MRENDELQSTDDIEDMDFEIDDSANLDEHLDQEPESAPDSEPDHEQKTVDDAQSSNVNQESINKAIDKQHAKYREEQRKRVEAEKELETLRSKYGAQVDPEPKIPDVDYYSNDVEAQVNKRDAAVREHQQWQFRQQQQQSEKQKAQQQSYEQQNAEAMERQDKFYQTAKQLKMSQATLDKAVTTIGTYGLGQQVAEYLMTDDKGVQMTAALAKNPALLSELSFMQPHQAILHIERNVRSRLKAVRPSNAKRPPTRVSGKASAASDSYPLTGGKVTVE